MAPPAAASQQCAFLGHRSYSQLQTLLHASLESSKELVGGERHPGSVNGGEIEESSTLGSRPPSCEHKCGGCVPCLAIQVPTAMDRIELHYSNYEPEGWKCKCGSTFFNP
uniref:Epidermal patterning factor-like protein n=1 Tax=Ananas comosus var. bracteatus TaxID=296719 RepID=A0A6V7QJ21_ANACO|nr:unnamed protein product [Ananas comosus var. bracteatus]